MVVEDVVFSASNFDCIETSYYCSDYSCAHFSKCLLGQKVTEDTCDYNFECYLRCCSSSMCSSFLECYANREFNAQGDESKH